MAEDTNNIETTENNDVTTVKLDSTQEVNATPEIKDQNIPLEEEINQITQKNKMPLLKKVLIGLVAFLLFLIVTGIILYSTGFFEPEEIKEPIPQEQIITQEAPKEDNSYKFDLKDINSKKLNEQLANLTNKNILQERNEEREKLENEKKLLEEQKKKEEEALKLQEEKIQKEKDALEETKLQLEHEKAQLESLRQQAMQLKEQLVNKDVPIIKDTEKIIEESHQEIKNTTTQDESSDEIKDNEPLMESNSNRNNITLENNSFLKFINVAKIKGQLYKKYLDKVVSINPNIILCRDDKNRIELYFGPFKNELERDELLNKLLNKGFEQAYKLEFTKEEFDSRCNY